MRGHILFLFEILILTALILATRCANYQDVFVDRNIYFTDADCYARMTRVRMCFDHPGLIIRHHDFENFPQGTTPHTTAPLDYLIVSLSILLRPFTTQPVDLAGAVVSPLLALIGGWPGALVAQQVFRHKSRKVVFQFALWTTVALNCGALIWLTWMEHRH